MIVVTGGAGFIGSAMVWKLNEEGYQDVLVADRMGSGKKWENLAKRSVGTIMHKDEFLPWLETSISHLDIDAIFHLGASSSTTEMDSDYLVANNLNYSQRLWQLATAYSIPFYYASSASTYGAGEHGFGDDPALVPKLRPLNPYGFSKQKFDDWVLRQKRQPPAWAGLKFFNVYGPQEYHKGAQASVVHGWVPQVQASGEIRLFKSYKEGYADGEQVRDFVYVKDVVDVLYHLFKQRAKIKSGIYNLGSGEARSFADLARAVFQAMHVGTPKLNFIEMPEALRAHYQYRTEASLERLRRDTGYTKPMTSLEDGVNDYVRNYLLAEDRYL